MITFTSFNEGINIRYLLLSFNLCLEYITLLVVILREMQDNIIKVEKWFSYFTFLMFFIQLNFLFVCLWVKFRKRNFTHPPTSYRVVIWDTCSFPMTIRYKFTKLTTFFSILAYFFVYLSVCLSVCLSVWVEFCKRNFTHSPRSYIDENRNACSFPTTIRYDFKNIHNFSIGNDCLVS